MLVSAVRSHQRKSLISSIQDLPEELSRAELVAVVEAQSNWQYHIRTHEKRGILRSKPRYSRAEALEILNLYPKFAIGV